MNYIRLSCFTVLEQFFSRTIFINFYFWSTGTRHVVCYPSRCISCMLAYLCVWNFGRSDIRISHSYLQTFLLHPCPLSGLAFSFTQLCIMVGCCLFALIVILSPLGAPKEKQALQHDDSVLDFSITWDSFSSLPSLTNKYLCIIKEDK